MEDSESLNNKSIYDFLTPSHIFTYIGIGLSLLIFLYLFHNRRKFLIVLQTLPRDICGAYRFSGIVRRCKHAQKNNLTVSKIFDMNVDKHPDKICFIFEDTNWTFKKVQEISQQVANFFSRQGFKKGDSIAIFMENRPEFPCIWLGLSRIGVVPAFINYNLRRQSLKHCIDIINTKAVIFGTELSEAIHELSEMDAFKDIQLFSTGKTEKNKSLIPQTIDLDSEISAAPKTNPIEIDKVFTNDPLFYIYTSGTTGLPKAAVIKHFRFIMAANGLFFMNQVGPNEIIYNSLPLYHMTGGMVGVGLSFIIGATVVIKNKFSASNFWKDCRKYNVTVAQYLGDLCRYLLAQKPSEDDKSHSVKKMIGNGLRAEIWKEFTERFGIKEIGEVYGSTEGNCNISNINNKVGAIGFVPILLYKMLPMRLIKIDFETGEPLRDTKTGLALKCGPNEPGECVGKIIKNHPIRDFEGYTDKTATSKKIISNVFSKNDIAFRSGDILVMDEYGYYYFKDRLGDTFRWKGENVSCIEVEGVLLNNFGFTDVIVYGVKIPNREGSCGMAVIGSDPKNPLDLEQLAQVVIESLPFYARPLFTRLVENIDVTGTFKMKKSRYQKEGFDIQQIKDQLYFLKSDIYVKLDEDLYNKVITGKIRF